MSATLRLTRQVGSSLPELRRGRFEVSVDGKDVGSLENKDIFQAQIDPGRHTLRLHKGRYASRELDFEVADGNTVTLRCHGARVWPTWLLSFAIPSMAISVSQE